MSFETPEERNKQLKPIDKPPAIFPLAAADIEGVGGPHGFESAGLLINDDYHEFSDVTEFIAFIRQHKYKSYRIAFHHLRYDFGILEPYLSKEDYPMLINGHPFKVRIASGKNHPRFLVDSLKFSAGLPLSALGHAINLPKYPTPPQYNQLHEPVVFWHCHEHNKLWCSDCYLKRDTEIVYEFMRLFQSTVNDLGGQLQFTLASTAMDLFRRKYLKETFRTPFQSRNDFARHAYYGGRVEPYKFGRWDNVNGYDINSLYPYVMYTYELPHPNTLVGPKDITDIKYIMEYEGVSEVTIDVPDTVVPLLPFRENGKLFFPTGKRKHHYTHVELREALKRGAKIKDIHYTLYSTTTCNPFKEYVSDLYNLRLELKTNNDPRELIIKIMLNSLYGKFGQRVDAGLQEIWSLVKWLEKGSPNGCVPREFGDFVTMVVPKKGYGQPSYINTLWAAYITAYARLTLFQYMEMEQDTLLYCDTDSVFIHGTLATSSELGHMKQEYNNVSMEVFGPKAYRLFEGDNLLKAKCKGVPMEYRNKFLENGYATFERPVGLLEAGKLRPLPDGTVLYPSLWREVTKQRHDVDPKRKPIPVRSRFPETALSVPWTVTELHPPPE